MAPKTSQIQSPMTNKYNEQAPSITSREAAEEILAEINKLQNEYEASASDEVLDTNIIGAKINYKNRKTWLTLVSMLPDLVKTRWREGVISISPELLAEMDEYQNVTMPQQTEAYKSIGDDDIARAESLMEKIKREITGSL